MARIAGVNIPSEKGIGIALTHVYGLGRASSSAICRKAEVDALSRVKALTESDLARIRSVIEEDYEVEGDLLRRVRQNIKQKVDMGCYSGLRHRKGLPVRGQRTCSNARTCKRVRRPASSKKGS